MWRKGEETNKLTQITTDKGETTRSKVLAATEDRMDEEIRTRMLCHPDLFAFDAKYHRITFRKEILELHDQRMNLNRTFLFMTWISTSLQ